MKKNLKCFLILIVFSPLYHAKNKMETSPILTPKRKRNFNSSQYWTVPFAHPELRWKIMGLWKWFGSTTREWARRKQKPFVSDSR